METIADFILDITENSIRAKASEITSSLSIQSKTDTITLVVTDNGCGMDEETLQKATEPFYTTKTTRKIGLGLPLRFNQRNKRERRFAQRFNCPTSIVPHWDIYPVAF